MPQGKGSEWDYVTVAEPDEAEGEIKAENECELSQTLSHKLPMQQLAPAQAHPGPAATGASSGLDGCGE
eukprot:78031-Pelagomonas_calceolata.AAC.4